MDKIFVCTKDYFVSKNGILYFKKDKKYILSHTLNGSLQITLEVNLGYGDLDLNMMVLDMKQDFERWGLASLAEFREKRINSILCD